MNTAKYEKLISKLREIFRLAQPDLDFGIYRVMHLKRKAEERYLDPAAPDSHKVCFGETIQQIETRLGDSETTLNSFMLSPSPSQCLLWRSCTKDNLARRHGLFLEDGGGTYIPHLLGMS